MEGTLVDQDSTQVAVDNVMVDLEGRFDEDSFVQVPGEISSQRQSEEPCTQPSEKAEDLEQKRSLEQAKPLKQQEHSGEQEEFKEPEISKELAQPEQIMSNPLVLQTPLNE